MQDVLILAAGEGSKFWPYQSTRNKVMFSLGNKALIQHTVEACLAAGVNKIVIVVKHHVEPLIALFRNIPNVEFVQVNATKGTAHSFVLGMEACQDDVTVLYGDVFIPKEELLKFLQNYETNTIALNPLKEDPRNVIACEVKEKFIVSFGAHQRGNAMTHVACGFHAHRSWVFYAKTNPNRFSDLKVGVGSPFESYLEESINEMIKQKIEFKPYLINGNIYDFDKPWHALHANAQYALEQCSALTENNLGENASIHESARIEGFVQLGKNSRIGHNVWVRGNVIIGENTIVDQGVILEGTLMIGDNCTVLNHAKVHGGSIIGPNNKLDQGFEYLGGVTLNHVYMVHYGEYYGCVGEHSDLGAGTTCGTLRFDDGLTTHSVKGRKETPLQFSNASYLGDYTRTGVGAILMPGVKIGAYSVVGSGVILSKDVPDKRLIYVKQELVETEWGPDKYGW